MGDKVYSIPFPAQPKKGRLTLDDFLKDQKKFVIDTFSTNPELVKYQKWKFKVSDSLHRECVEGIREGVNAFIGQSSQVSENLFDHDINSFFYHGDLKTPIYHRLINNPVVQEQFRIEGRQEAPSIFCEEIASIMDAEYRDHVQRISLGLSTACTLDEKS